MNTQQVETSNVGLRDPYAQRPDVARTIVHLKDRRGWRSTRQEAGSYGAEMLRMPEQVQPRAYRLGEMAADTVVARDFRLVKEAIITDHRSGERVREVWYEED